MLGLSLATFTALHLAISLIGLGAGFVAIGAMLAGRWLGGWTAVFLGMTILTSATGFLFPAPGVSPAKVVGGLSLVILLLAVIALYGKGLRGGWRRVYVFAALGALYLNSFVGLVQTFQKQPALAELAPTQSEPAFIAAQLALLLVFIWLGVMLGRRFQGFSLHGA